MTWTTTKPTQPGWYWVAQHKPCYGWIVYVYESNSGLRVEDGDTTFPLNEYKFGDYWSSEPVPEPTERGDERETQP